MEQKHCLFAKYGKCTDNACKRVHTVHPLTEKQNEVRKFIKKHQVCISFLFLGKCGHEIKLGKTHMHMRKVKQQIYASIMAVEYVSTKNKQEDFYKKQIDKLGAMVINLTEKIDKLMQHGSLTANTQVRTKEEEPLVTVRPCASRNPESPPAYEEIERAEISIQTEPDVKETSTQYDWRDIYANDHPDMSDMKAYTTEELFHIMYVAQKKCEKFMMKVEKSNGIGISEYESKEEYYIRTVVIFNCETEIKRRGYSDSYVNNRIGYKAGTIEGNLSERLKMTAEAKKIEEDDWIVDEKDDSPVEIKEDVAVNNIKQPTIASVLECLNNDYPPSFASDLDNLYDGNTTDFELAQDIMDGLFKNLI